MTEKSSPGKKLNSYEININLKKLKDQIQEEGSIYLYQKEILNYNDRKVFKFFEPQRLPSTF